MPSIKDLTIVNSNTATPTKVEHGLLRTLCSPELCNSKNLTVYKRTVQKGKQYDVAADNDYHLVYVMNTAAKATVEFDEDTHAADEGAGVLLTPGESARFDRAGGGPRAVAHDHAEAARRRRGRLARRAGLFLQSANAARIERRERRSCAALLRGVERASARRQSAHVDERDPSWRDALQRRRGVAIPHAQGHARESRRRGARAT